MIFTVPIHESNDCHEPGGSPTGGQFCGDGTTSPFGKNELEEALSGDVDDEAIETVLKANKVQVVEKLTGADGVGHAWSVVLASDRNGNTLFVVDDNGYVKEAREWVYGVDASDWIEEADFNEEFWEFPATLYHATTPENAAIIEKQGLAQENKTRGLTNRSTSAAVFTSTDPEAISSYGNDVFEINTAQMKKDGYTPEVRAETGATDNELESALAAKVGIEDWWTDTNDPGGEDPNTVVVFGHIPAKYLTRMD